MIKRNRAGAAEQGRRKSECFCLGLGPELSNLVFKYGPPDAVREHFRNARVEVLKAIRAVIDQRISELSRHERRGTKMTVE